MIPINCYLEDRGIEDLPVAVALSQSGEMRWQLPSAASGLDWRPACNSLAAFDEDGNLYMVVRRGEAATSYYELASISRTGALRWLTPLDRFGYVRLGSDGMIWVQESENTADRGVSIRDRSTGEEVDSWTWDRHQWVMLPWSKGAVGIDDRRVSYRYLDGTEETIPIQNASFATGSSNFVHGGSNYLQPDGSLFLYTGNGSEGFSVTKVTPTGIEWERAIGSNFGTAELAVTADGGVAVAWWRVTSDENDELWITRFSRAGEMVDEYLVPTAGRPWSVATSTVLADDRGNVVVSALTWDGELTGSRTLVLDSNNSLTRTIDVSHAEEGITFEPYALRPEGIVGGLNRDRGREESVVLLAEPSIGAGLADMPNGGISQPSDPPVVLVHGLDALGKSGDRSEWGPFKAALKGWGWNGKLIDVGYYDHDKGFKASIDDFGSHDGHRGGPQEHTKTNGHNKDTDIGHLAYHWAWYVYETYSEKEISIKAVGHSMGGLIIRYAVGRVQEGDKDFPPSLLVDEVVTLGTPHGGSRWSEACFNIADQCQQMSRKSGFIKWLKSSANNPQATAGTEWTAIGSYADFLLEPDETAVDDDMDAAHRVMYLFEMRIGHGGYYRGDSVKKVKSDADVRYSDHAEKWKRTSARKCNDSPWPARWTYLSLRNVGSVAPCG